MKMVEFSDPRAGRLMKISKREIEFIAYALRYAAAQMDRDDRRRTLKYARRLEEMKGAK